MDAQQPDAVWFEAADGSEFGPYSTATLLSYRSSTGCAPLNVSAAIVHILPYRPFQLFLEGAWRLITRTRTRKTAEALGYL